MKGYINVYKKNKSDYNYKLKLHQLLKDYLDLTVEIHEYSGERVSSYIFTNEPKYEMIKVNRSQGNFALGYAGYILEEDEELYRQMIKRNQDVYIGSLNGIFSLSMVNLNSDSFTVWNNITGVEPVFWSETDEHIVVGNKALLVHLLAFKLNKPVYKTENLVSFLNNGYYTDGKTSFLSLNVLPINSKIKVSDSKVSIREIDDLLDNIYTEVPDKKMFDDIADSFLDSFKGLEDNTNISLSLTGGKDSRMILSGLYNIGVDFKTSTNGYTDNPDVIIAREMSEKLNIEHTINEPVKSGVKELKVNLLNRTYKTVKSSEGMLYAYENVALKSSFNSEKMRLGGQGGELLRGGFARSSKVKDFQGLERAFQGGFARYINMINKDLADEYLKNLKDYIQVNKHFSNPKDVLNKFFLETRTARWSGASKPVHTMSARFYTPLMDSKLIRKIQLLKTEYSSNDYIIYNILSRIEPRLLDIPFAKDRWKFESDNPRGKNELLRWIERKPVYPKTMTASFNWRTNILDSFKDEFYEGIFTNEDSPIFDIVNKEKVRELFDTKLKNPPYYDKFLWSLYTANVMLSNNWVSGRIKRRTSTIVIPEKKETKNKDVLQEIRPIPSNVLQVKHRMLSMENVEQFSASIYTNAEFDSKQNYYIQIFDKSFTEAPSDKNTKLASVKKFNKVKFIFEAVQEDSKEVPLEIYFMQYDTNVRLSIKRFNILLKGGSRFVNIEKDILDNAEYFKVAIKIKNYTDKFKFAINQMRLEGYK